MEAWHDFLITVAGASAALVGLLFVGLSINLDQLLEIPHLLLRAAASLLTLTSTLIISCLLLAPDASLAVYGLSILVVSLATWGAVTYLGIRAVGRAPDANRTHQVLALVGLQLATLPTVMAGVMVWQREEEGLNWLVPAFLIAFGAVMVNSWVLTVESRR